MPNNRIAPLSDGEKMPDKLVTYVVKTDNVMMGHYEFGVISNDDAIKEFGKIVQRHGQSKEWPWKLHKFTNTLIDEVIA